MTIGILTASYITSSVLFILALGGLSNQEKAKRVLTSTTSTLVVHAEILSKEGLAGSVSCLESSNQ